MRLALISPPTPGGRFINRDLYGGMGIRDDFGTRADASFVAFLKAEGTVLPELALPQLAALLSAHDVRVFDGARVPDRDLGAFEASIAAFGPDWLVVSTSYAALADEVAFTGRVRAATGAKAVLFGYTAHFFAADVLGTGLVDAVVDGEPEAVIPDLVASDRPGEVPGLWTRDGDRVATTGTRLVDDLDALPIPAWQAMPLARYRYFPLLRGRPFATVSSSRGCTFGCDYCPYAVAQGTRYRAMSPGRVADELQALVTRFGVRAVLFRDPSFGLDRDRVLGICRAIRDRGVRVEWGCETRLDGLDDEVIAALASAGCRSVEIGLDSLSPAAMAENRRRSLSVHDVRERLAALRRGGLDAAGLFVIGLPGDDVASVRRTLEVASRLPLAWVNYEIPIPFPGTRMYQKAVARGQIAPVRFQDLRGAHPPLAAATGLDLPTLRELQSEGMRRFYVSPRRVLRTVTGGGLLQATGFLLQSALRFAGARGGRAGAAPEETPS